MQKRWTYLPVDVEKSTQLNDELKTNAILCDVLAQRGIYTFEDAKEFFRPNLKDLHDPFLMKDMDVAINRIVTAIENEEKILIYGDYDVDGTTSVTLLSMFFNNIGANTEFYIPDRYKEGYGVSMQGIDYAHHIQATVIITIDCGVTAIKQIEKASGYGIDTIVCDHHLPSEELPKALAILDPKRKDDNYPYKELSGCGIGFKLCMALAKELNMPSDTYLEYIDLVTVSIASDIVPITGENRIIAYYGLKKINENPMLGLKVLIEKSGMEKRQMTISDIVFGIGPKINAPGRMEKAHASVEILMSQSLDEAEEIASTLDFHNSSRKEADSQIMREAVAIVDENPHNYKNSIVIYNPSWSKGVIGIVASRLVERYYKPTIVLSEKDGVLTGSARSIEGFSIYNGINQCSEHVIQFGGHDFAAGLTLEEANIDKFREKFDQVAEKDIAVDKKTPEILINREISFSDITMGFYTLVQQMAPFGPENMQPVFSTLGVRDTGNSDFVGSDKKHLKLSLRDDHGNVMRGIAFNMSENIKIEDVKSKKLDICYTIQINEFKGRVNLDLFVKDIKVQDE